jgi:cell wall assembly regulator SMI1
MRAVASLAELLQRLEHWLQTHRPDYYKTLNPGIQPLELDRFQNYVGKPLPHSFDEAPPTHCASVR